LADNIIYNTSCPLRGFKCIHNKKRSRTNNFQNSQFSS